VLVGMEACYMEGVSKREDNRWGMELLCCFVYVVIHSCALLHAHSDTLCYQICRIPSHFLVLVAQCECFFLESVCAGWRGFGSLVVWDPLY
jgi:hypothetical protein